MGGGIDRRCEIGSGLRQWVLRRWSCKLGTESKKREDGKKNEF